VHLLLPLLLRLQQGTDCVLCGLQQQQHLQTLQRRCGHHWADAQQQSLCWHPLSLTLLLLLLLLLLLNRQLLRDLWQ
jgi:hypothetical protein